MPLFEIIKTNAGTQTKNELQQQALVWQLNLKDILKFSGKEFVSLHQKVRIKESVWVKNKLPMIQITQ